MIRSIWDELADLESRIDEAFGIGARPARALLPASEERAFTPVTDIFARDDNLVIRIDLPGVDVAKEVKVEVEGDALVISGERHRETKVDRKDYHRMETYEGRFERHISLPPGVDASKVKAGYHNGVLEVIVPGATGSKAKARSVPVKVTTT